MKQDARLTFLSTLLLPPQKRKKKKEKKQIKQFYFLVFLTCIFIPADILNINIVFDQFLNSLLFV